MALSLKVEEWEELVEITLWPGGEGQVWNGDEVGPVQP